MRRGLRLRLALTHALVALLAIVVVAIIVNVAGGRRFDTYLSQVQKARNETVLSTLEQTYRPPAGWDASAVYALSRVAMSTDVDAAVFSPEGTLLFTVQGRHTGQGMMNGTGGSSTPAPAATPRGSGQVSLQSYPVVVNGQKVATAEIYFSPTARAAAEYAYQSGLTRNLVVAGVVAAVIAFLVSLWVSRRITGPLEELTDAAQDVAMGNLDVRVSPRADDEVGALTTAFNTMADRLARDEQWRRDMTADLSHELRTPLATIQSRVEALEDGVLPATPENLRVIGAEVERLGRLLGALRDLNELESEDLDVEHEVLDLAEVARDAAAAAETAYTAKGVTLESRLAAVSVRGDRDRLLEVAADLLDNALKSTPQGGRVTLAVAAGDGPSAAPESGGVASGPVAFGREPGARWAVLTVSDSGAGIDPVDLPFVFDRFYRSQAARGTQGVSLGLAIARGLVEAQGGVIEAADGPEGGALFTVRLPLAG